MHPARLRAALTTTAAAVLLTTTALISPAAAGETGALSCTSHPEPNTPVDQFEGWAINERFQR